jgi:hypothetical protein
MVHGRLFTDEYMKGVEEFMHFVRGGGNLWKMKKYYAHVANDLISCICIWTM